VFNTEHYNACIIYRVRVWSSAKTDKSSQVVLAAGSPFGNTVPALSCDDVAPLGMSAKAGYTLLGPYRVPWSKAATIANISSDSYPLVLEITALFL
jgi:hypothetical protein